MEIKKVKMSWFEEEYEVNENGEFVKCKNEDLKNAKVKFYNIKNETLEKVKSMNKDTKDFEALDTFELMYNLIPIMSNVENDITFEEYVTLLGESDALINLTNVISQRLNKNVDDIKKSLNLAKEVLKSE